MQTSHKLVLLGIGNVLQKDDGVGVYAVDYLKRNYTFSPKIELINGGVEGINLLDIFIDNECVVIVDTISIDDAPGSIYNIPTTELGGFGLNSGSAHEIGVLQCLDMLDLQCKPRPESNVIAIIPQEITFEFALSPELTEKFDLFIAAILQDLKSKGVEATPNETKTPLEKVILKFKDPSAL